MRALLVGFGKAGCRIVNTLTENDKKSPVKSVKSYIFDCDSAFLSKMNAIDQDKRIHLSPNLPDTTCESGMDYDISNIPGYFSDSIAGEIDAVFICTGLGGKMGDAIPEILEQMNSTFADPVFTILTLPAKGEGARISARAATQLENIRTIASAAILFDNETWIVRLEEQRSIKLTSEKERKNEEEMGLHHTSKLSINDAKGKLNELLCRRIELLLRAGEITENGIETAEAVLDAGEVLNTLTHSDIVSIGYAAERLPSHFLGFLNRFRMEKYLLETNNKRTARIVELAKRAVYEEVSIPCDLTTANKALILITGPSNELSMKGFHTIRKWIDRSIKGLEMRAGDYPVNSTLDVGVIIVLAGIENVPRIAELNEIKKSYDDECKKTYPGINDKDIPDTPSIRNASDAEIFENGTVMSIPVNSPDEYANENLWNDDTENANPDSVNADDLFTAPESKFASPQQENTQKTYATYDNTEADVFEDKEIPPYNTSSRQPFKEENEDDIFEEKPIPIQPSARPEPVYPPDTPQINEYPLMPDMPERTSSLSVSSNPKKKDPQITISGGNKKKKNEKIESSIPLPKRNKQPDLVLSGQADLGKRKVTSDGMDRTSIGSNKRPKETDGVSSVGSNFRPKETDGISSIGIKQRPKETDGVSSVGSKLRPKDDERMTPISTKFKLNDEDRATSVGIRMNPKDEVGNTAVGAKLKPRDDMRVKSIRTHMKPKDEIGNTAVGAKLKPRDDMNMKSIGARMNPKDEVGNTTVGAKLKPRDDMNMKSIGERMNPKDEVGNTTVGVKLKPRDDMNMKSIGERMKPEAENKKITLREKINSKEMKSDDTIINKKSQTTNIWKNVREAQKKQDEDTTAGISSHGMKWM